MGKVGWLDDARCNGDPLMTRQIHLLVNEAIRKPLRKPKNRCGINR